MPRTIEIRNNFHGNFLGTYPFFLMAGIIGFYLVYALFVVPITAKWFGALLIFLAALGLGLHRGRNAFDTRVQVVLSPDGFRDRRAGDILVPWSIVERGTISALPRAPVTVVFHLASDPDPRIGFNVLMSSGRIAPPPWFDEKRIQVEATSLDTSAEDILKAAKAFAPHIEIDLRRQ